MREIHSASFSSAGNLTQASQGRNGAPSMGIQGYVGKKTEDPKALKLLIAASEYAAAAASRLSEDGSAAASALPQLIDHYVDIVFGLEVHFVFPNLSAEKRDLLVAIMKVRNSISAVLTGSSQRGSAGEKAALEKLKADLEQKFLELRSRIVECGIEAELDPIQKKIFQDEFFSITLDKACATTLFFRTDAAPRPTSKRIRVQPPETVRRSDLSLQPARDEIPKVASTAQREALGAQIAMQAQSAKPATERSAACQQPDVAKRQPDFVPNLPEATFALSDAAPMLTNAAPALKLADPALNLAGVAPRQPGQRIPRRKTVLLISADSGAQDLVGRALREAGHDLLLAKAGFSGYATAMRERPDLVLVDLSLSLEISGPDACLDGEGVLKMLSKLPSGRALPFLGLVSDDASEAHARVLASGARACLQKPLDPRVVLEAVQNAWADLPLKTDEPTGSPWTVSASI